MNKRKCSNCEWWQYHTYRPVVNDVEQNRDYAECHKNAPVCGGTSEATYTAWPVIKADDFCGEFKEK